MKQIIYISLMMLALQANAQNAIPNNGFESWMNIGGWFENPVDWQTSNNQIMISQVFKDSNAYAGTFSLNLTTYTTNYLPFAKCGFKLNDHPVYLKGYTTHGITNGDSALVRALIYYQGNLVDSARYVVQNGINPGFTFFMVPVSNGSAVADSCEIIINGCQLYNDGIKVDDIALVYLLSEDELQSNMFEVFPNPAINILNIHSGKQITSYQVYDTSLKMVLSNDSRKNDVVLDVSRMSQGSYFLTCTIDGMQYVHKFQVKY